jgi:hypothetical protein
MAFARAIVDASTQPSQALYRRIGDIEKYIQNAMDYMCGEAPEKVYGSINRLSGKSVNEADIRKRYVKLMLAYLMALVYLSVELKILSEEAAEYLKKHKKA